jgi:hypothetical protein
LVGRPILVRASRPAVKASFAPIAAVRANRGEQQNRPLEQAFSAGTPKLGRTAERTGALARIQDVRKFLSQIHGRHLLAIVIAEDY